MGTKCAWLGLALLFGVSAGLSLFNVTVNEVVGQIGGILLVVGAVLIIFDK